MTTHGVTVSEMVLSRTTQDCVLRNCCFEADKYKRATQARGEMTSLWHSANFKLSREMVIKQPSLVQ
jgi:hypothetical protein